MPAFLSMETCFLMLIRGAKNSAAGSVLITPFFVPAVYPEKYFNVILCMSYEELKNPLIYTLLNSIQL